MCDREEFERRFPVPNGVKWSDKQGDYTYECIQALQVTCAYSGKWEAWQAARAQHDGRGEAVGFTTERHLKQPLPYFACKRESEGEWDVALYTRQTAQEGGEAVAWEAQGPNGKRLFHDKTNAEMSGSIYGGDARPLVYGDTHPQPAQQGSVPDEYALADMANKAGLYGVTCSRWKDGIDLEVARPPLVRFAEFLLATTPQTADNWIKCSERLPTEADDDYQGCVWALFEDGDIELMEAEEVEQTWDDDISITHWKPTGLKRPNPPTEGEE